MTPSSLRRLLPLSILTLLALAAPTAHAMLENSFLYFPTHEPNRSPLTEWRINGELVGYGRVVEKPRAVWLIFHGNGGQAADRQYIVDHLPADTCAYVVEYPGYGLRPGQPSMASINEAARTAYASLRAQYPTTPLCVLGESLGSGASCHLCTLPNPPNRLVLMVPFDTLLSVAKENISFLPVSLLMRDKWDNVKALSAYKGPVEIFGARNDTVIRPAHARALAKSIPQARYTELPCGHNEWSQQPEVRITD